MSLDFTQMAEGLSKSTGIFDIIGSSVSAYNKSKLQAAQYKAQAIAADRNAIAGNTNLEGERVRNAVIKANMKRVQAQTQGRIGAMSSGRGGGDSSTIADLSLQTEQDVERDMRYQQLGSTLRQQAIHSPVQQQEAMSAMANQQSRIASNQALGNAILTGVTKTIDLGVRIGTAIATGGASEAARLATAPQSFVGGTESVADTGVSGAVLTSQETSAPSSSSMQPWDFNAFNGAPTPTVPTRPGLTF